MIGVILAQPGVVLVNGLQDFFGFFNEDAQNLVVQQFLIGGLGGLHHRFGRHFLDHRWFFGLAPGWLCTNREAEVGETVFGNPEHPVVLADALGQALQVVLDTGHGVRQGVQLFPVRNLLATEQHIGDVALGGGQHLGDALQRYQRQAASDAVEQAGDMLDFPGVPLGGDEVDDGRLDLLQRVAGLPQQCSAGFAEFLGAHAGCGFVLVGGRAGRGPVAVEAGETGFDVQQGAGDVHQGAIIDGLRLHAELVDQLDLFGNDLARNPQAKHRQGVGHLAQARQQIFKFVVLAQFGADKQIQLVLEFGQLFVQRADDRVNGFPTRARYPGSGRIDVVVRRQRLVQLVALAHCLDLRAVQIPGPGDVIEQVFEQGFRHRLLEDIGVLFGQPADLGVQFAQQGFDRGVHRIDLCLQGFDEGTGGLPEFAPRGLLAQPNQTQNHFLQVLELGCQVFLAHHACQGKLIHLAQFADMTEYLGILQALGRFFAHRHGGLAQVRFEQRSIGQQGFAASGPEVVQQRQQHHGEIVPAAGQVFEILWQLQNCAHQHVDGFVNVGDAVVENCLGELFHLFGQQCCTVKLYHLQGAVHLMEIIQAEAQARGVVSVFDVRFQCMLALGQRVLYFSPNPVEGDAVMVIAHNHSGYSSSAWRLIHASTCSEGSLCRPGGCQSVSSPWPSTSSPPGASRSASRLTISRRRQRRK